MRVEDIWWNYVFQDLMKRFWKDKFRSIPVFLKDLDYEMLAEFIHTQNGINSIILNKSADLSPQELTGVLLHEMCHHVVFEKYGWEVEAHGKEWIDEMKFCGFTGVIDEQTDGIHRFTCKDFNEIINLHNSERCM